MSLDGPTEIHNEIKGYKKYFKKAAQLHNTSKWGAICPAVDSNVDEIDFSNMDLQALLQELANINNRSSKIKTYFSPEINTLAQLQTYYLEPEKNNWKIL